MAQPKDIFGIKEIETKGEKKSFWTRIGIAFLNQDGSMNCHFDYMPVREGITVHVRDKKEKFENETTNGKTDVFGE